MDSIDETHITKETKRRGSCILLQ